MTVTLHHGDCLDIMPTLPDHLFDAIIADLPYGTTACKWDSVIPFVDLWVQYKRLIKERGAIVLFGSQPFTSALVMSNLEWFKYDLIWQKIRVTGHLDAKRKPLREHEHLLVFCDQQTVYNPQMTKGKIHHRGPWGKRNYGKSAVYNDFGDNLENRIDTDEYYPRSIIKIRAVMQPIHSTQKPVALLEYLIRTYTNPGDTILDNVMGSGTTMVACVNTGRNGHGIELYPLPGQPIHKRDNPDYFDIAEARVAAAQNECVQLSF